MSQVEIEHFENWVVKLIWRDTLEIELLNLGVSDGYV